MAKTPESIAAAARHKARFPWVPPEVIEAWEDPEIFAKQWMERVVAHNHPHGYPICVHAEDGRHGLWFPDKSYRYRPEEIADAAAEVATADDLWELKRNLRWGELMRGLYRILDRDEWERVVLRFGPYSEADFLVVEISPDGLTHEHWQGACALAKSIQTRPEPPPTAEDDLVEPF